MVITDACRANPFGKGLNELLQTLGATGWTKDAERDVRELMRKACIDVVQGTSSVQPPCKSCSLLKNTATARPGSDACGDPA